MTSPVNISEKQRRRHEKTLGEEILPALHRAIHRWYAQHGRKALPWRQTNDPYAIYISEIMLQQTQVKTVLERYYFPFLAQFPSLQALADAPLEAVLKAWEGLGYYSRARNLHKAAKQAAPQLPESVAGLMALPGIGQNTAHAIAAFAYHQPVPVMEANVARVLARVFALEQVSSAQLWQKAEQLLDPLQPFDYNQAMMDIGAMVCTRRSPACDVCPLAPHCRGKQEPERYPQKKKKTAVPVRQRQIWLLEDRQGRVYVTQRDGNFLAGLYGFPEYPQHAAWPEGAKKLGDIQQSYSHFTLQAEVLHGEGEVAEGKGQYVTLQEAWALPMSRADHKVLRLFQDRATSQE